MLTEAAARWLLVLHTALGVAAVGAATHLVLWLRRMRSGQPGRLRAVRRFAWLVLALQLAAFAAGNAMYPTYKVEVRAAYLENSTAVVAEQEDHQRALERVATRERARPPAPSATGELVRRAMAAARWFDVKEHWIALGILGSLGLVLVLGFWDPRAGGRELGPVIFGLAVIVAATLWLGAVIGVATASWRAV
ncbi:MAG TPA: hypothetical protein VHW23_09835 [Kofleriaceae bacterium]|nr:hypothetical protein [Kofleriaceae bacterium]